MRQLAVAARLLDKFTRQKMEPREFCRRWFNAHKEMEAERGYRAKCVNLLSRIVGIAPETINSKWGSGLEFDKMPKQYRSTLAYADTLREIMSAASKQRELLDMVLERLKDLQ